MNRDREHDRSLDDLLRRPHLLGIENVLYACREVKFYRPHSKDIYCEPDLIFFNGRYFAKGHHDINKMVTEYNKVFNLVLKKGTN